MYINNFFHRVTGQILLLIGLIVTVTIGFQLDDSPTSYAQFRRWGGGYNGSLELEFKTENPNGLLLYTDDGGTYDFFELKLVEGALRLRYNLGGGAQILTAGRDLNDEHWHQVRVHRQGERTRLTVDGDTQEKVSRGKEFQFGKFATNSDVFVGGMPPLYNNKLTLLALPSVIFEPRFVGSVRNLVYADQEFGAPRRQEMRAKEMKGVTGARTSGSSNSAPTGADACEAHDPCQHGGICISTDSGPICECRHVEYEGPYCEKDKAPSEASFRGNEFLSFDLSQAGGEPIVSAQDTVTLHFKTRQPNGLLFYAGDGADYLNVAVRDGGLSVTMGLSNGKQELQVKPKGVRFDDNQWHKLTVHRKIQEISQITSFCRLSATVDNIYNEHAHLAGQFSLLRAARVYVGGAVNARALPGARVHHNLAGCLRRVELAADALRLDLLALARAPSPSPLVVAHGRVQFSCPPAEPADPVTFTTRDAHLVLPPWNAKKAGNISFKFRTNEPNGLIVYNSGVRPPRSDLFAVELLNGHIYIHLDLGSGGVKVRASRRRVDDGAWHELALRRAARDAKITVDGYTNEFLTPGDSNQLELDGNMYVGGTGPPFTPFPIPAALWTGVLRQGFVGCLKDFNINSKPVDLAGYAKQQDYGSVRTSCHVHGAQCGSRPCHNSGTCSDGWNRFVCDCTSTNFTGPTCGKPAATLYFNGTQHLLLRFPNETRTQTEEVVIRFRTSRPLALLVATSSDVAGDSVELSVAAGRLRLALRLAGRDKTLLAGRNVNNNEWHTVRYSRRASNIKLQLDNESPIRAEAILGKQSTLQFRNIHLGGLPESSDVADPWRLTAPPPMPGLVGALQQFWFNGRPYLELARASGRDPPIHAIAPGEPQIRYTAKFIRTVHQEAPALHRPVTFKSKHTFVGLPMLKAYSAIHLELMFRTTEPDGLILFHGGRGKDFLAIELIDGHVHYAFNLGDGLIRARDSLPNMLNDNRWHQITIRRPAATLHTLTVDDILTVVESPGTDEHLDLDGILYLGGVHRDMYTVLSKDMIESRHGFEGCLAGLDLNGDSPNVLEDAVVHSSLVSPGCEVGQPQRCSHNVCANRGYCIQHEHGYTCDCDMTSYTGPTCSDESVAYEFGLNKGIIKYTYPSDKRPDVTDHAIALGFVTTRADAVLLRILSSTSKDYLEIEIVEGNIFIVYNLGNNDHPLGEIGVKVNDNAYHVVRFKRSGANSTLQIDDYNVQGTAPSGEHLLHVFNSQSAVEIGGRWNREKKRVERPFSGVVAGVVVNGLRVLDAATERSEHVTLIGDVQLVAGVHDRDDHFQRMQQTPASGFSEIMDDLVFSGAGSGADCNADDEDECPPPVDAGSGDDLVTPVYVPPTRRPSTTTTISGATPAKSGVRRPSPGSSGKLGCDDDDEDCLPGSGSGEVTEDTVSVTSQGTELPTGGAGIKQTSHGITTDTTSTKQSSGTSSTPGLTHTTGSGTIDSGSSTTTGITGHDGIGSRHPSGSSTGTTGSEMTSPIDFYTNGTTTNTIEPTIMIPTGPPPAELPPIIYNPPYIVTPKTPTKNKGVPRIHSEAAESTALIIGIVAGILIAIVLIIIIVLKFRPGGDTRYKVEESGKGGTYSQGPHAALLGNVGPGGGGNNGTQYQLNGGVKNGVNDKTAIGGVGLKKKRDSKDIKEWYV